MYTKIPFHIHELLRGARHTKHGVTHSADEVPIRQHKEYPRMPRIPLPLPELQVPLVETMEKRMSVQQKTAGSPTTMESIGALLGHSLREYAHGRRPYPSGGSLYPIETYLIGAVVGSERGVYHYHPKSHSLEHLWDVERDFEMMSIFPNDEMSEAAVSVVFTGAWQRTTAKYGDFGYLLALLEAGHMAQNMLLVGAALGISMNPVAAFDDDQVTRVLDIREEEEQPVYALAMSAH